ncbi:hypothetical protein ACVB8X_14110 [Streptomyces sp. NRAIS4]
MADIRAFPQTFIVQRDQDVSGVSGEGVIAEGVQFSDGWVVTHWLDQPPMNEPKTDVWHNKGAEPFQRIHGHGGSTRIVWADHEQQRRKLLADVVEAYDVPAALLGTEAERAYLARQLAKALGAAHSRRDVVTEAFHPDRHAAALADAVMPIVAQLLEQRDRAQAAAGRAYKLADLWEAAHGSAMCLVRAAGAELRDVLDEDQADVREQDPATPLRQRIDEAISNAWEAGLAHSSAKRVRKEIGDAVMAVVDPVLAAAESSCELAHEMEA